MGFKIYSSVDIKLLLIGFLIGVLTTLFTVGMIRYTHPVDYAPAVSNTPSFKDYYSDDELKAQETNKDKQRLEYFLGVKDTYFPVGFVKVLNDGIVVLADMKDKKYSERVAEYACKVSRENYPGAGVKTIKVFLDNPAIEKPILVHNCFEANITTTSVK